MRCSGVPHTGAQNGSEEGSSPSPKMRFPEFHSETVRVETIGRAAREHRQPVVVLGQNMPDAPLVVGLCCRRQRHNHRNGENCAKAEDNQ